MLTNFCVSILLIIAIASFHSVSGIHSSPSASNCSVKLRIEIVLTFSSILFFLWAVGTSPPAVTLRFLLFLLKYFFWLYVRQIFIIAARHCNPENGDVKYPDSPFYGFYNGEYASHISSFLPTIHVGRNDGIHCAHRRFALRIKEQKNELMKQIKKQENVHKSRMEVMETQLMQVVNEHAELLRMVIPAWDTTIESHRKLRRKHGFKINKSDKVSKLLTRSLEKAQDTLREIEKGKSH